MQKYFEIHGDGHNVRCKLYANGGQADRAVVFCTGFAGHKDNRAAMGFAEKLLSKHKNAAVVVFDWPAHGDDVKKKLTLADCETYLELVVRDLPQRLGARTLSAYGVSFGCYLLLKYLSERGNPFDRLVLRCPAVDMYQLMTGVIMTPEELEKVRRGKEVQVGFDRKVRVTGELLEALKENDIRQRDFLDYAEQILLLHGTKDEVVPFDSVRAFSEEQLMELIPIEGADHRFQNPTHMSLATKYALQFLTPTAPEAQ